MRLLRVALEDGFRNDEVIVRLNGKEVFAKRGVSTRRQIGLAESFEVVLESEPATLEVLIPLRGLSGQYTIPVSEKGHVGVSADKGSIHFHPRPESFGYA